MDFSALPALNAGLNSISAIFLLLGYVLIRQRAITGHTMAMLAASLTSTLFLISYITYHLHHGTTHFQGRGFIRFLYFSILISHTFLAVVIAPFVALTLYQALRGNFSKHMAIARVTLPLWFYVSVTGVVIYWMLYKMEVGA